MAWFFAGGAVPVTDVELPTPSPDEVSSGRLTHPPGRFVVREPAPPKKTQRKHTNCGAREGSTPQVVGR